MINYPPTKLLFTHRLQVRWSDMDKYGRVNHALYFTYMEQAETAWLESLGINLSAKESPVTAKANCAYHLPIFAPMTLIIQIYAGQIGRSSLSLFHTIYAEQEKELIYAQGHTVIVWVNHQIGKSIPLPEKIRQFVELRHD
ncbi:acyl-CoA thioesterase [Beggiatoa leptomitoformis]|uniref:Acyl-CoA thioesterase n=1 Tax=Beggiatoa leptomitoformis TaxID=288004 RepID=A0A2N9YCM3_9GAMM|nr:thioesterase family protein [Beggiatoa leptomitoformis]ALG66490.1 acyl-CoA thioesterase [Beggiatoa leptomitoformis]AUI68218.1 acyl-CoA thioesterase [Beggiatoa leptomitoformis]